MKPPLPGNEKQRIEVLWHYDVLDTPPEAELDDLTQLAAHLCEAPIALISLVDEDRQWFKSRVGLDETETARDISFCAHAILQSDLFIVPDATKDPRFADNPLVTAGPQIRFYAGAPLITPQGYALGALCVIDHHPRHLREEQEKALRVLARIVIHHLELRRRMRELSRADQQTERLAKTVAVLETEVARRRKAEDEIRRYADIVQNIQLGLNVWQLEDPPNLGSFRLMSSNPAATRITGVPMEAMVGKTMAEVFPRMLETDTPQKYAEVIRSGQAMDLGYVRYCGDERLPERDFAVHAFPLPNQCVGVAFENVTDRRLAEQAQLEGQARKAAILDSAPDAIVTIDHEGIIYEWNPAAERMFGCHRSAVLGKELAALVFPPASCDRFREALAFCLATGNSPLFGRRVEMTAKRSDGTEFPVELSVTRVPKDGPPIFTGFIRDITERKEFEEALRKKEATLLEAQRIGRIGSWEVDLATRRTEWSEETYRIFGRVPGEFVPSREAFYEAVHPADLDKVRRASEATLQSGEPYRVEHRIVLPDGSQKVVLERAELVFDLERRPIRWLGTVQDITERKEAEEALRASQALYSSLVESLPQNVFRKDINCRFTFANSKFCHTLGRRLEEIIGRNDHDLFPPELAARYQNDDRRVMETGENFEAVEESEIAGLGKRFVQVIKTPIYNAVGKVIGIQGMYWDVTERKRMEEALRRSEQLFRSLIENSTDVIVIINDQAVFVYVSDTVTRILKYRPEELTGRSAFEFVHADDVAAVREALFRALSNPEVPTPVAFRFRHASGSWRVVEAVGKRQPDVGGAATLVINARDITERRQLEEQLRQAQKMESVGQLAGGVAHDFNNILTVIQGHASMLLASGGLRQNELASLQQISLAAERAANLTRQLLTFGRKQMLQPKLLDLNGVVDDMTKMLQRILGEDISLHVHLAANLPTIKADQSMLEQVVLNLAVNSRDAMPRGGQLIVNTSVNDIDEAYVSHNPDASAGRFVCLSVSDTGCGIQPHHLPHIFEPFFTTKDVGKGTGLGLATVYGIVKQHRGWITVASEVGKGTIFQIFLPASAERPAAAAEPGSGAPARGGRETILIVEDESALRSLVRSILERNGYQVLEASSGVAALELWPKYRERIDLLLTDMVMPDGMSGRELGQRLQSERPGLKVLYTSGYSADVVGEGFALTDGVNFLQKPYHPRKLAEAIRACLEAEPGRSQPTPDHRG